MELINNSKKVTSTAREEKMEVSAKVSSLFIYPIKSCRGISVTQAPLTPTGFRWDRQWIVVNHKGRAYTQRNEPKLALVQVELPNEAFLEDWKPTKSSYMAVRAPGMDVLKVTLNIPDTVLNDISVWEWSGSALDEGAEAAKWFSSYLGKTSRLVRFNAASQIRPVNPTYADGHKIMFPDLFPFMLLSQESLDALNNRLKEPIPINRFRPNILVKGCEPFSEDIWKEIKIGNFMFEGVKLCSRCKIPTIDQDTGVAGSEPNETLKEFRSDKVLLPNIKHQGKIYFGQDLVWKDKATEGKGNVVKIGDPVFVLKKISSVADAAV